MYFHGRTHAMKKSKIAVGEIRYYPLYPPVKWRKICGIGKKSGSFGIIQALFPIYKSGIVILPDKGFLC